MLAAVVASSTAGAATLFQDSFESGRKASSQNGFSWGGSTDLVAVSSTRAASGSYSLLFPFQAVPTGEDSFEEQRLNFGKPYNEIWIKYDLYVPSNYVHRRDGASNNKFFAIFNNDYSPGFQANFSLSPGANNGSNIEVHYYRNGAEQEVQGGGALIGPTDLGKWHRIVMHFKVPTSTSASDGVMELWKNGQSIYSSKSLAMGGTSGLNYMDEAYILGWANSGFNQDTLMYIDDVVVADTAIPLTGGGTTATPNPPVLNSVQ
jgi:hypothetical protein